MQFIQINIILETNSRRHYHHIVIKITTQHRTYTHSHIVTKHHITYIESHITHPLNILVGKKKVQCVLVDFFLLVSTEQQQTMDG